MKIELLSDSSVSPNLNTRDAGVTCSYSLSTVLDNGDVACVYRRGTSKHSYDGILVMQTSPDRGKTWSDPAVVFDGTDRKPALVVVTGALCQTAAGTLLATFGLVKATRPDVYVFSEEGLRQERSACILRSEDRGETWSAPLYFDTSAFSHAGITTKPFIAPDGRLCVPFEIQTRYGPNGTAAAFSDDDGRTFSELLACAADSSGRKNLCDARFAVLQDGRIIMLLWTFLQESEETIEVHRSFSSDSGKTWTSPEPIGFVGQITAPLPLPSGGVIAASNFRLPPEGIRLWSSPDNGERWNTGSPLQMWDVRQSIMMGESVAPAPSGGKDEGVWEALEKFTFGTPDLLYLDDDTILLTYYATMNDICHIRACRFRVKAL